MPYNTALGEISGAATGAGEDDLLRRLMAHRQQQVPMVFNGADLAPAPAQPAPGVPVVFNGPTMASPTVGGVSATSPVRDDVVRALGGRNGQMPSMNQFLAGLPQSTQMQFGSGQGQIGNGLGIGGPLTQGYTPAFQGPEQRSDHTQAGMNAYNHLLGQYTSGPESPTQAMARALQGANDTIRTQAEYGGPNSLRQQQINQQTEMAERERFREMMRYAAGARAQGQDWTTINTDIGRLGSIGQLPGAARSGQTAAAPGGAPGAPPAAAPPAAAGAPAPAARGPLQFTPQETNQNDLEHAFNQVARAYNPAANVPTGGNGPAMPTLPQNPAALNNALTAFVNSPEARRMLQTPEGINALREFIIAPNRFGQGNFDRWFTASPHMMSILNPRSLFGPTEEQAAHRQATDRLMLARNAVAGPNDQLGYTGQRYLFGLPLWSQPGIATPPRATP